MDKESKKHGWPFWFAVGVIALPVLYVASFGPACWLAERAGINAEWIEGTYYPLLATSNRAARIQRALRTYANFGVSTSGEFEIKDGQIDLWTVVGESGGPHVYSP